MRTCVTNFTPNICFVGQKFFRTFVELMTLLPTRFTPRPAHSTEVVEHDNLQFFRFVSLVKNCLNHRDTFVKIVIFFSSQKNMQWLVFLFVWIVDFRLTSLASNTNLAFALLFKFLLSCSRWSYNLSNVVYTWIVRIVYIDLFLLFWGLIIWWRNIS